MKRIKYCFFSLMIFGSQALVAEDVLLLEGTIAAGGESALLFQLHGESREQVVGGDMSVGDEHFNIQKVSIHQLLGAVSEAEGETKYAVFSSSYSEQTAVGVPWVAAKKSHDCEQDYNSFVAIYSVNGKPDGASIEAGPYAELMESLSASQDSVVYCFLAMPPS